MQMYGYKIEERTGLFGATKKAYFTLLSPCGNKYSVVNLKKIMASAPFNICFTGLFDYWEGVLLDSRTGGIKIDCMFRGNTLFSLIKQIKKNEEEQGLI